MELYHVYNRGVEKRTICESDRDRVRFVHSLYEFNDTSPANNVAHFFEHKDIASPFFEARDRDQLVDIHGWCLMRNHYHLLLSERFPGGIAEFTRKLGIGFTHYYNECHDRDGVLFQGRTKKKLIETDAHFLYIMHYIHLNPLDYMKGAGDWRNGGLTRPKYALRYLDGYRWSSFFDYCDKKNFPSVITTGLFGEVFRDYRRDIEHYLKDISFDGIESLLLETRRDYN